MKNIAVILAAGSGNRFGSKLPKQFINLAGKPIIAYTINAFEINENIDEICIVTNEKFNSQILEIIKQNNFTKVKKIINGGKERKDSSLNAIKTYENQENINLIFHDAVRPFISQSIINNVVKALNKYNAVDVAIPATDTIIKINQNQNIIEDIPERSLLRRGQTPQAFNIKTIKKSYELLKADKTNPIFTDDCGLVKKYLPKEKIYVVNGEEKNIKITYPQDLLFAEKLIQLNSINYIEKKDYSLLKNKVIIIFGGNSGIGKNIKDIAIKYKAKVDVYSRSNSFDITNIQNLKKAFEITFEKYKKIDAVINCAAILTKKPLIEMKDQEIFNEVNTNFISTIEISKYAYKYLKLTKGSLILFTSSSYTRGRKNYSIYSSTKAGIVNFAQAISQEWQNKVKVNVINPSRTATPMRTKTFGKEDDSKLLNPADVAKITLNTLLSDLNGLVIDIRKEIVQ